MNDVADDDDGMLILERLLLLLLFFFEGGKERARKMWGWNIARLHNQNRAAQKRT